MVGGGGDAVLVNATMGVKNLYYPVGFALAESPIDVPSSSPLPFGERDRVRGLSELKRFVLPQDMSTPGHILNVERAVMPFQELLAASNGAGHISSNRDPDGTVRRVPQVVNFDGNLFPAFGLSVAAAYLQVPPENILLQPGYFLLKGAGRPGDAGGRDLYVPVDKRG